MRVFRIDHSRLIYHLRRRKLSYEKLANQLHIHYTPTKRTVDEIRHGRVPVRWRKPVADLVGVPSSSLYVSGRVHPDYLCKIQDAAIPSIHINHKLTKAAIAAWVKRDGDGGIDPEHLDALARFLGVRPIDLVTEETAKWMKQFLNGGQASPPD